MRKVIFTVLALSFATLVGCAADSEDTAGNETGSEDELRSLKIDDDDNGKTFTVEKGGDVKVALSSNATTGYKWKVVSTTRTFGYPTNRDGQYQGPGAGGPVGGGGSTLFVWKTNSPLLRPSGTAHTVKLEYRRPFEPDSVAPAKTFTFKIKIKQGAEPAPEPGSPVVLKQADDGKTVRAKAGQDVVVKLAATPSAGYNWHVESTNRTFGYPEKSFEGGGAGGPVGAGGTTVLTWKTGGPLPMIGSHTVKLKYSRGENGAAEKQFSFTVNIVAVTDEEPAEFACPPETVRTINCMPPTTNPYCKGDFRSWAQDNCDVSYLD